MMDDVLLHVSECHQCQVPEGRSRRVSGWSWPGAAQYRAPNWTFTVILQLQRWESPPMSPLDPKRTDASGGFCPG
jgi:hypothetical protein